MWGITLFKIRVSSRVQIRGISMTPIVTSIPPISIPLMAPLPYSCFSFISRLGIFPLFSGPQRKQYQSLTILLSQRLLIKLHHAQHHNRHLIHNNLPRPIIRIQVRSIPLHLSRPSTNPPPTAATSASTPAQPAPQTPWTLSPYSSKFHSPGKY